MKSVPELLAKKLDREWRLLDPDRIKIPAPSMETPSEDESFVRRVKVGRVDETL